jgi:hypothetical protein
MPCRPVPVAVVAASKPTRVLGDVLQGLEDAEVGGGLGVPAVASDAVRVDQHRDRNPVGVRAQRGAQSLLGQQRRIDELANRRSVDRIEVSREPQRATAETIALARLLR